MTAVDDTDLLLPEGTRLLHIGPQKTGTTAIQYALNRSREQLREHGVVVPRKGPRPLKAVWSLLGTPDGRPKPPIKHWEGLVRRVAEAGDLRVCISTEDWARTDLDGAKKTVAGLGGERAHVVATARRLDKLLPSQWQQRVKMRRITYTYEQWLEIVLGDDHDDPAWQNMWIPHDIESVVNRWTEAASGIDRFTLLVADEGDRGFLPRSFERMLGLPTGMLDVASTEILNPSRSYGRIEVIRRLTEAFARNDWSDEIFPPDGPLRVRLTDELKTARPWPNEQSVPPLPPWAAERVAELSAARAKLVDSLDVRVVGDPANLLFPEALREAKPPEGPSMVSSELAAYVVELTVDEALKRVDELLAERDAEIAKLRRRVARLRSRQLDQAPATELAGALRSRVVRRARRLRR